LWGAAALNPDTATAAPPLICALSSEFAEFSSLTGTIPTEIGLLTGLNAM